MSKKALIILAEGFEEIEASAPIDILRRAGIEVVVAGLTAEKVTGAHKATIIADTKFEDVESDFDACILPGGMPGAGNLASSEKVKSVIAIMHQNGKLIAAICASPALVLAPLGILDNKSATCYPSMETGFSKNTVFKTDDVVIDGNIITSRGPGTAMKFALAIVEKLLGKNVSDEIKEATLAG